MGRPTVTYIEDLPNYDQLTTVKNLLDTVENRYKKVVNVHAEQLNFRSIAINPGESLLDYESRLNSFSKPNLVSSKIMIVIPLISKWF